MKKKLIIIFIMGLALAFCSCRKLDSSQAEGSASISGESESKVTVKKEVDLDLSVMSSTMVYSEVYMMMVEPDTYIGKKIKMKGVFALYQNKEGTQYYYTCVIKDATACCAQGIEFVLDGNKKYPDDYPDIGDEIIVEGIFETYQEDGNTYCQLNNANLTD